MYGHKRLGYLVDERYLGRFCSGRPCLWRDPIFLDLLLGLGRPSVGTLREEVEPPLPDFPARWGRAWVVGDVAELRLGARRYELSDWLGNVRVVITDRRIAIRGNNQVVVGYRAEVVSVTDYYSFGAEISLRSYEAQSWYRYGYQAQEKDHEIYGKGAMYHYTYRQHDARLGRFWSVDPLARKYPWNSPYAFGGNRVVDAVELEGLEYVEVRHYADGHTEKVFYYTMTKEEVKRLGGTPRRLFNAAPYGPEGRGVLHIHYKNGEEVREMWQRSFFDRLKYHGLYSGPGSVTKYGNGKAPYDYSYAPIDIADAIAKTHDRDYDKAYENSRGPKFGTLSFLEDVATLTADRDMVERVNKALGGMLTFRDFRNFKIDDEIETPVYTRFNFETLFALLGQRILIGALANYKEWKIENGFIGKEHDFGTVGKRFMREYPLTGLLLWIAYKRAPKEDPPKDESERGRDGN
jgi:RHS repeat-associated protein